MKPIDKGVYALIMRSGRSRRIQIGRLGKFRFPAGSYVYVGSAWGPGGLAARIGRHLKMVKKCRWHIDYLRQYVTMKQIWVNRWKPSGEHVWAEVIGRFEKAAVPAEKFGSSDCRCATHLFYLPDSPSLRQFNQALYRRRSRRHKALLWHEGAS